MFKITDAHWQEYYNRLNNTITKCNNENDLLNLKISLDYLNKVTNKMYFQASPQ